MSFFLSSLGVNPVDFSEGNHGQLEGYDAAVSTTVEISSFQNTVPVLVVETQLSHVDTHISPSSAISGLQFGFNVFTSQTILVCENFIVCLTKERMDILNLYQKVDSEFCLVARIMADDYLNFANLKSSKTAKDGVLTLLPGIHNLLSNDDDKFEIEYYFMRME